MKKLFLAICLSSGAFYGCATNNEPKMTETKSGAPEVFINKPPNAVKPAIISNMTDFGANLEKDSDYKLEFSKEPDPSQNFIILLTVGNEFSTNKIVTEYTLFPKDGGTRVIAKGYLTALMPLGKLNKQEITGNTDIYNQLQKRLNNIKDDIQ